MTMTMTITATEQADLLSSALILQGFSNGVFYLMVFVALCLVCKHVWGKS